MYKGLIPFNTEDVVYDRAAGTVARTRGKFLIAHEYGQDCHRELNVEFEAELLYDGMGRGRSSAVFYYKKEDGTFKAQIFMSEMSRMIELGITPAKIKAVWCFQKRGANYGLEFVREVF